MVCFFPCWVTDVRVGAFGRVQAVAVGVGVEVKVPTGVGELVAVAVARGSGVLVGVGVAVGLTVKVAVGVAVWHANTWSITIIPITGPTRGVMGWYGVRTSTFTNPVTTGVVSGLGVGEAFQ
jgi:hypothetical protein